MQLVFNLNAAHAIDVFSKMNLTAGLGTALTVRKNVILQDAYRAACDAANELQEYNQKYLKQNIKNLQLNVLMKDPNV